MTHCLTFTGWNQHLDSLDGLVANSQPLDYLSSPSLAELTLPYAECNIAIGWSLGGLVLTHLVVTKQLSTKMLVLIATPHQFVASDDVPYGMAPTLYKSFCKRFSKSASHTSRHFQQMVIEGDVHADAILPLLNPHPSLKEPNHALSYWLETLGNLTITVQDCANLPPTLLIHGERDSIVCPKQSEWLHQHLPTSQRITLDACGHAPHLHDSTRVHTAISAYAKQILTPQEKELQ